VYCSGPKDRCGGSNHNFCCTFFVYGVFGRGAFLLPPLWLFWGSETLKAKTSPKNVTKTPAKESCEKSVHLFLGEVLMIWHDLTPYWWPSKTSALKELGLAELWKEQCRERLSAEGRVPQSNCKDESHALTSDLWISLWEIEMSIIKLWLVGQYRVFHYHLW